MSEAVIVLGVIIASYYLIGAEHFAWLNRKDDDDDDE